MFNKTRLWIITTAVLIVLALGMGTFAILAQDEYPGTLISDLNIRTGPGTEHSVITILYRNTQVTIEGRNNIGNWLLIHSADGAVRGWAATRYVNIGDADLDLIPVKTELFGDAPAPAEAAPPVELPPEATSGVTNGMIIDTLNVRSEPNTNNVPITQIAPRVRVVVESRNQRGDWVMIHTLDNTIRGWVASRYVALDDGVNLSALPVNGEVVTGGGASPAPVDNGTGPVDPDTIPPVPPPTDAELAAMLTRLQNTPVLYNMTTSQVYTIFYRGQRLGNNRHVFMKVGDSLSAVQQWLIGFGQPGQYDLGSYGYLQATIDWFSASPRPGVANSFVNNSFSNQSGFVAHSVLEAAWVDPAVCGGNIPIHCEYNLNKPSVAVILFGAVDMWISNPYSDRAADAKPGVFRANMERIVDDLVNLGVIPVLTTFSSHPDFHWDASLQFNNIILDIAQAYGTPVINLWAATQPLPNHGVHDDFYHNSDLGTFAVTRGGSTAGYGPYWFNGSENMFGITKRNLLTLQALDQLRQYVLSG
jgi:uncharacterized protein YraI